MLEISAGTRAPVPAPLQWGTGLFVPGLEAKPWYERASFDWVPAVESRYARIRAELRDFAATGVRRPYLASPNDATQMPADETPWTAVFLYRNGRWISDAVVHCRETQAAIAATPQGVGEALLSLLAPHSAIDLHSGGSNVFLTCHLPIDVPPGCAIGSVGAWLDVLLSPSVSLRSWWRRSLPSAWSAGDDLPGPGDGHAR